MVINKSKTKLILFNTSKTLDFTPKIELSGQILDVEAQVKLLGLWITNDMNWSKNTNYITQRGFHRLWILRRLKQLGAPIKDLIDTYMKMIRSILELAVPTWHPGLKIENANKIERVQKCALSIILGREYIGYKGALKTLKMETLTTRREKLCLNFALKAVKHPLFSKWFAPNPVKNTRNHTKYIQPFARTNRYSNSTIPYLTRVLNNHHKTNI